MTELTSEAKAFLKRASDRKLVFTNGCFDILHRGHVGYLNEAKKQGDLLFVGLNSDESIKQLKGTDRPINFQADRKYVLENLKSVDFVEIFHEQTPCELIKKVQPNVFVKGGDWKVEDLKEADIVRSYGGEIKILPFFEGHSTTDTITKILNLNS